jgi:hypothetical protein
LESDRTGFKSQVHYLAAMCPWESYLNSLNLNFFVC